MKKIIIIPAICFLALIGFSEHAFGDYYDEPSYYDNYSDSSIPAALPDVPLDGQVIPDFGEQPSVPTPTSQLQEFNPSSNYDWAKTDTGEVIVKQGSDTWRVDQSTGERTKVMVDDNGTVRQYGTDTVIDYVQPGTGPSIGATGGSGGGTSPTGGGSSGGSMPDFQGQTDSYKYANGDYAWKANDGNYYSMDKSTGEFYEVTNPTTWNGTSYGEGAGGASGAASGASDGSVITTRELVGKTDDGNQVYKDNSGNYSELRAGQLYPLEGTSGININPLTASEQAANSASSSTGKISVPQSDGSLKTAEKGSDGTWSYTNSDGSKGTAVDWSSVSATSANTSITSAGLTTPSGQQLVRNSSGQLMQMSGNQMVPYSGATVVSGGGTGSGLFGALGSAVGSLLGGAGSAVGSLFGGTSTGGYMTGSTGGIGGTSGYYGTTGGGSYGTTGGYAASPLASSTAGGWNPARYASTGLPVTSIYSIVQNIVMWALSIFGFLGIIGFVISGVWYLLAAGDETLAKRAKNGMLYSIIGVVVGLIGLVIIFAANSLLSGSWFF